MNAIKEVVSMHGIRYFLKRQTKEIIRFLISTVIFSIFFGSMAHADTLVGGTIATDTTWTRANSPYIVGSTIVVKGTDGTDGITTLTIEPGVVVRFHRNKSLIIGGLNEPGVLVATGTVEKKITFTANQNNPVAGDWGQINFPSKDDDTSGVMEHCVIEYGGSSYGAIHIREASPTLKNVTVKNSKTEGIYVYTGGPVIENCLFSDNQRYDLYYKDTAGGAVTGSTIHNGIFLPNRGTVTFSDNTIHQNNAFPIVAYPDAVGNIVNDNTFTNVDADSCLKVNGSTLSKDATWTDAMPISIPNYLTVKGTDGVDGITTLTIEPGAVLKLSRNINIGTNSDPGALAAVGTADEKIRFTSGEASPAPGDWGYINFSDKSDDASTIMEHCVIEYGGKSGNVRLGSIYIKQASPKLQNITVQSSASEGIYVDTGEPVIEKCLFGNNQKYDLYYKGTVGGAVKDSTITNGIFLPDNASMTFSGNRFHQNNRFPMVVYPDAVGPIVNDNVITNVNAGSYLEVRKGTISKDATWTSTIPYHTKGNLAVKGTDGADGVTTLTLEPGVLLRFCRDSAMDIGTSSEPGALVARGTADYRIKFTSQKPLPAAGDWRGILFNSKASEISKFEYCVVEYGGAGKCVLLDNVKIPIHHNIFRHNGSYGVFISGTDCSAIEVNCNNFEHNFYGLHTRNGALPTILNNNFIQNSTAGLNSGSIGLVAENNWWNDAAGPNQSGDKTLGNVDTDPWSTEPHQCFPAETNRPPYTPLSPTPADNAVRISTSNPIPLVWASGDPNTADELVHDLYLGTSQDNLTLAASAIAGTSHTIENPIRGITYYWKVVARDNHGLETAGPVWQFTGDGLLPDLIVSGFTIDPPGNLPAGQNTTLTATILNSGEGPVFESFHVGIKVDGVKIGELLISSIILAGESATVSLPWTYTGGNPALEIIADSQKKVLESHEDNNQHLVRFTQVADMMPPTLVATIPADGTFLQAVSQITATLADSQSAVNDAAVTAGFVVKNANSQTISGTISEASDAFTFTPNPAPLADGVYTVTLPGVDIHGNTQNYSFDFTVDSSPPAKPVITGGSVASGTIQARPFQNQSNQFVVELTGTRDPDTAVYINGVDRVEFDDTPWSVQVGLQAGANSLEVKLKDRAGGFGDPEWVDISVTTGRAIRFEYDDTGRIKKIQSDQ